MSRFEPAAPAALLFRPNSDELDSKLSHHQYFPIQV